MVARVRTKDMATVSTAAVEAVVAAAEVVVAEAAAGPMAADADAALVRIAAIAPR